MGDKIESEARHRGRSIHPGLQRRHSGPDRAVGNRQEDRLPGDDQGLAGGGGKGLRVAFNDAEAHEGFSSRVNEARNSFGDDRVFIEKYVSTAPHRNPGAGRLARQLCI